jgi:putative SOS response-associated peptidase YedK
MCSRYFLDADGNVIAYTFNVPVHDRIRKRFNIAPTQEAPVVRVNAQGAREVAMLRWGLVPHWAKDAGIGAKLNNARAEGVLEKPSFRDAFHRRRCLIPADGFYEWKSEGKLKQPYYISLKSGQPLAMGGLWESWRTPDGGLLRTCAVITTGPNAVMAPIHDRMPVIIGADDWQAWLSAPAEAVMPMLEPPSASLIQAWPVSRRVSKTAEDDAGLIEPLPAS